MKTINHRKDLRQTCVVPVDGSAGNLLQVARTIDISRGGVGFLSKTAIPLKEKIAVEVELSPGQDPLLMLGEVRWVCPIEQGKNYRVGMKFVKVLRAGSKSRLTQYFEE